MKVNATLKDVNVDLIVRDPKELGNGGVSSTLILVIVIAIIIVIWIIYRTIRKRKEKDHYKDGVRKR